MTLLCHARSPSVRGGRTKQNVHGKKEKKAHIKSSTLLVYTVTSDLCWAREGGGGRAVCSDVELFLSLFFFLRLRSCFISISNNMELNKTNIWALGTKLKDFSVVSEKKNCEAEENITWMFLKFWSSCFLIHLLKLLLWSSATVQDKGHNLENWEFNRS